jgi:hypothetical protein
LLTAALVASHRPVRRKPFLDHYSATQPPRASEEHPIDVLIGELPEIASRRRKLSRMEKKVQSQVHDHVFFVRYVDCKTEYTTLREQLYFNAGFERGLLAGRAESRAANAAARALAHQIELLVATHDMPLPDAAAALLGVARAMVLGLQQRRKARVNHILDRFAPSTVTVVEIGYWHRGAASLIAGHRSPAPALEIFVTP